MNKYSEKTKAAIREHIEKGIGMAEIAKKYKVPYHVVVGVKAAGTKAPPAKKKKEQPEAQQALQAVEESQVLANEDSPAAKYFLARSFAEKVGHENNYLRREVHHLRSLVGHYMPTIIDGGTHA